jgi:WD40 repeat protein
VTERPESPYKGLNAFDDSDLDALFFFGRERESEVVVANLIASRLTVLYGPSGVGKSSLLRAAVVRTLRELPEAPLVVVFSRWGGDPAAALTRATGGEPGEAPVEALRRAQADRDLYLVLDQVEEYFLYHADDRGPGSFAEALPAVLAAPLRVNVLVSLREDSLAKLDRFTGRILGLFANTLRLDRLDRDAARAAIVRPVERFAELTGSAASVEPALVERVLDEVASGRIDSGLGGSGAVAGGDAEVRIEAPYLQLVLQRLWDEERAAGSDVLRLETLGRIGGAEHVVEEHLEGALDELVPEDKDVAARLFDHLVTPSGTKIAHEIPDLADFGGVTVEEVEPVLSALAERRILRSLDEGGRVRFEIFHDVLAQPVLAWRARHRAERELERRLEDAHRRRRRLQRLFALALVALGLMAAVTVFALDQRAEAQEQADRATARALEASSAAVLPLEPELGLALAREAALLAPSESTEGALRTALLESRVRATIPFGEPLLGATVSGDSVLAGTAGGSVVVKGLRDGRTSGTAETGVAAVDVSFTPDGTALLTGADGRVRVIVTGEDAVLVPGVDGSLGAEVSGDGASALAIARDGVRLVELASGDVRQAFPHPGATSAALSSEGRRVVTGGVRTSVRLWNVAGGAFVRRLVGEGGRTLAVAYSPRGTVVAAAGADGSARLWRVTQRRPASVLAGHRGAVTTVGFSEDGTQVVTAGSDRTVRVWRVDSGASLLDPFRGHTGTVLSAAFLGGAGSPIVTASSDGTVRLWDATVQPVLAELADLGARVDDVAAAGDELEVVAGDELHILDATSGQELRREQAPPRTATVEGPDGSTATIRGDTVVLRSGERETVLRGHGDAVTSVAFSSDGTRVVTTSRDREARIWDAVTGEALRTLTGHRGTVNDAAFNPNGRWIVTGGPSTAGVWDAETGALAFFLRGHRGPVTAAAFDATGRAVVTAGADGTVRRYECEVCGGLDDLVALAEQRLEATGRELTDEERERYVGD